MMRSKVSLIGIFSSVLLLAACGLGADVESTSSQGSTVEAAKDASVDEADEVKGDVSEDTQEQGESSFNRAVNTAISAGEMAQTARTIDEWRNVEVLWSEAIELMKSVPQSDENYEIAQVKADEYLPNLEYARKNTEVKLEVSTSVSGNKVSFSGTTNLPNGFLLSFSGSRYHIEDDGPHEMSTVHTKSNEKVEVTNGTFQTEITIPTVQEVRQGLIDFNKALQEPGLEDSPINNYADVYVVGTPLSQSEAILSLIGGEEGRLLTGEHTVASTGDAFRVVEYKSRLDM